MWGRIRSGTNHCGTHRPQASGSSPAAGVHHRYAVAHRHWSEPFQVAATLGYDNVDERFMQLAGESRSLLPDMRQAFQAYNLWTEGEGQFWVFWKPALPLFIGFFIVGFYLVRTHDRGVLLVALLPLLSVLLLLLVIPFPAYRYAYPSVVMVTLLERWHSPARLHAGIRSL
jgi:hypothetical protein